MVDHADIRGLGTTLLASVGCLPQSRDERTLRPRNAVEGCTKPGLRLFRWTGEPGSTVAANQQPSLCLWGYSNVFRNSPHKGAQFPGNGDHDLIRIFAFGHQVAIAFTEPHLSLPADSLDRGGELFQAQLEMAADFGWIPVRPGPFDQGTTGMRIAGLGNTTLLPPRPTGIFRGGEPEIIHELAGVLEAREVAQFGHHGHGHCELD